MKQIGQVVSSQYDFEKKVTLIICILLIRAMTKASTSSFIFDLNLICSDDLNFYISGNHYNQNFELFPTVYSTL